MDGMPKGKHSDAGAPLRRARTSAWIVTVAMGTTTMAFQVYHSVKFGHMPWELAALYGVVPLLIAVLVLEIVAEWRDAPLPAKAGAYVIMGAAMFLSASATGAVVLHAAPAHWSLLFGALLDGAELLAAFFILNGPTAAQAIAEVARREAELTASVTAAREALGQAVAGHREALAEAEARHHSAVARISEENAAGVSGLAADMDGLRADLSAARREAEALATRNEALTRKLDRATGPRKGGNGTRKPAAVTGGKPAAVQPETAALGPDDLPGNWDELDTETRVLFLVSEKGLSPSAAGPMAGVTDARGRQIMRMARRLSETAPQDVVGETAEG